MRQTAELRESKPSAFPDDIAIKNLKIYRSMGNKPQIIKARRETLHSEIRNLR